MSLQSVLLTGVTGNVGAIILEQLLDAGRTVNVVLRSFAKSKAYHEQKYAQAAASGQLRFIEIPDMTVDGAFDSAAKNVSAIIHVATPLAYSDFLATVIEPAWKIDHNVLQAADRSPTVKRVIITGSIVSVLKLPQDMQKDVTFSEKDFNSITLEEAVTSLPNAYQYSKVSSEIKAWEYMEKGSHSFDLVFLLAPSIIGRSIRQGFQPDKESPGGMSSIYRECFDQEVVGSIFPYVMDVDDVARTHVKSLDMSAVPGNLRYLFVAGEINSAQLVNKVREKYPALRSRVPDGGKGNAPMIPANFDVSRSNKVFGTDWANCWDSAMATVEDILAYEAAHPTVQ